MDTRIEGRPSFAHLVCSLSPGETLTAEAGAMSHMDAHMQCRSRLAGGVFGALARRAFGGESMFVNDFSVEERPGSVTLTQGTPGDLACATLDGTAVLLQRGAFVACESSVAIGPSWAGFSSWMGGEGLFRLRARGQGRVWFAVYGGVDQRDLAPGQELVVDSGHLVAYSPEVSLKAGLANGLFGSFFSGEGIVLRLRGPGRVWLQSRSFDSLVSWTNGHIH
jgi:uncharacterized protein (TIGR00266 family)